MHESIEQGLAAYREELGSYKKLVEQIRKRYGNIIDILDMNSKEVIEAAKWTQRLKGMSPWRWD